MTQFRTSTFCSGGACVEVGHSPDGVILRDTKDRSHELQFSDAEWGAFVECVKNGDFDDH
jgi:hypothetical protein